MKFERRQAENRSDKLLPYPKVLQKYQHTEHPNDLILLTCSTPSSRLVVRLGLPKSWSGEHSLELLLVAHTRELGLISCHGRIRLCFLVRHFYGSLGASR